MKKLLIILCCSFMAFSAYSQDWKSKLKEELVTMEKGKFTMDDTQMLTFENGASMTFQTTATGDPDIINRDNFIAVFSNVSVFMLVGIMEEAGINVTSIDFKEVENPTGPADIKIHLDMVNSGLIMTITTEEGDEKEIMTWEEFFNEK